MAVRNPTQWAAPSGTGYITPSSGADIATQSVVTLATQAGVNLKINPNTYAPKFARVWTQTAKNASQWLPSYVITVGLENFIANTGAFIITNTGSNIVTNPTYDRAKFATQWTLSGA